MGVTTADLTDRQKELMRIAVQAERIDDLETAEVAYRAWMETDPTDPRPAYSLSLVLLKRGDYREGFELFEARLSIPELGIDAPGKPLAWPKRTAPPLTSDAATDTWWQQRIDLAEIDDGDNDTASAAGAAGPSRTAATAPRRTARAGVASAAVSRDDAGKEVAEAGRAAPATVAGRRRTA